MQDLLLRRLTPADAAKYRALMLQAYTEAPDAFTSSRSERAVLDLDWWEQRLSVAEDAPELVLGAFLGTQLLAVAGLAFAQSKRTRHKAKLFGMYVAPAARAQGVAKSLIAAILAQARARSGVELVQLTVSATNPVAQNLYARCGFQPFGLEPMAVQTEHGYIDKVHMWRALTENSGETPSAEAFIKQGWVDQKL